MKMIALLVTIAGVYLYSSRQTPVAAAGQSASGQEAVGLATAPGETAPHPTSALKRPLNRTHEVLDQVGRRNGAGEF